MARILIVNLTRFGDLLETQPLIHDLAASGHSVGMLCLDNFVSAVPLLNDLAGAWAMPGGKFLAGIDRNWRLATANVRQFALDLRRDLAPDKVINLTATLSARLLSSLVAPGPDDVSGFAIDSYGFGVHRGIWTSFFCGETRHRGNSPFNIADIFRRISASQIRPEILARPGENRLRQPDSRARDHALKLLGTASTANSTRPVQEIRGFVAFQLGASAPIRQWPVASFARLGELLWQKAGICPVLLGTASESRLAAEYASLTTAPLVDATGKTDLAELAALLLQCRLLVTNDTGTMHLAAGLGLASLSFFLATAQPWDTGPYLPGCCCLEPATSCHPCAYDQTCQKATACRDLIGPEPVARLILARLEGKAWQDGVSPELVCQARVWQTDAGGDGMAQVRCLSGHGDEDRSRWLALQRFLWCHLLDALDSAAATPAPNSGQKLAAPPPELTRPGGLLPDQLPDNFPDLAPAPPAGLVPVIRPVLEQVLRLLAILDEQAGLLARSARAGDIFLRNCDRIKSLLNACQPLSGLGIFWNQLVQDRGGSLAGLLAPLAIIREHLGGWVRSLDGKKV